VTATPKVFACLVTIFLAVTIAPEAKAQYDDSITGSAAWKMCYFMSRGGTSIQALDATVQPMISLTMRPSRTNGITTEAHTKLLNIDSKLSKYFASEAYSTEAGRLAFMKGLIHKAIKQCPNSWGSEEINEWKRELNKASN